MDISNYLERHQFYNTDYLTLTEADTVLDETLYAGLYHYFFDVQGETYHVLTRNLSMSVMMKPEFIILTNQSGLDQRVCKCDIRIKVALEDNLLTINFVIYDDPRNPLEVPFLYRLDDPGTSFELSKLLSQKKIDVFFIKAKGKKLYQEQARQLPFNDSVKNEIKGIIKQYLDYESQTSVLDYDSEDDQEDGYVDPARSILYSGDSLNIVIDRTDVETKNTKKYLMMLDPLYPNPKLTNKFCERVSLFVDGYDDDTRELWQIPAIRIFVKELDDKFHYWFYFLDKNIDSLMWITLALVGTGKGLKDKFAIDNAAFNDFLHRHIIYASEVCLCSGGSQEKAERIRNNVYKYYGMI